jgi:hypothetical protein
MNARVLVVDDDPTSYHASTTLSPNPYVWHWLAVTGTLFLLSAVVFALRLRAARPRPAAPPKPLSERA